MFMPSFDERVYLGGVGGKPFAAQGVPPPGFAPPLSVPATAESFMPVRKPSLSSQKAAAAAATTTATTTVKSKKPTLLSSSWPIKVGDEIDGKRGATPDGLAACVAVNARDVCVCVCVSLFTRVCACVCVFLSDA
jgi:hypothetical protein